MNEQKDWTFKIGGMTCDHCAASINEALRRVRGVVEISASYAEGEARVIAETSVDGASLASAIRNAGYRVLAQESRVVGFECGRADEQFDLAVIGGGSAAFAAAIKAAELGVRVALVEGGTLGGTCVNVGCLPSKTLIRAAEVLHRAGHHAFAAIHTEAKAADFAAVVRQKDELVAELRRAKYWDVLAAYPSVKLIEGRARFRDDGTLEVDAGLWWPTESS